MSVTAPSLHHTSAACVTVDLGLRSYEIWIGPGLLTDSDAWQGLPRGGDALIVTNPTVGVLYLERLRIVLALRHARVLSVELPDGEEHKHWQTLNRVFDALLGHGCDRQTIVYALGGGVVGDIAGFAAASFMRGVPYVQVPTTLLAQVDSSVGGKTAINHPMGKNLIGAFHQPQRVICDLDVLKTLPDRELRAGLAEVVKYGPIADWSFFEWMEQHADELLARDANALAHAVQRSCEIKAAVVAQDERESDVRAILNFGHTFGHAIEAGLGFGRWLHGEAVSAGMILGAALSVELGLIDASVADRLSALLRRLGLPIHPPALGAERYLALMRLDKKAVAREVRFVVLTGKGAAAVRTASDAVVSDVLEARCAG
ncbi:MAG TPA: 3-dehydroquinate synthase [Burkholderiaceae bacterium]|nr:3-dehydroquinate synthase [Burkholderiaceae bacterium]